jgi:hypothetical protein
MVAIFYRKIHAAALTLGAGSIAVVAGCASDPAPPLSKAADLGCPQWVKFPADHHSEADSPYLGCISAANLKAMLANPADLDRGRPAGPANGEREASAIEAYQQGKVKVFQGASASGAVSQQSGSSTSSTSGNQ